MILDRFLRYVKIDTQSDDTSTTTPSTAKQFDLLRLLQKELTEMGAADISLDDKGYLMATIPATTDKKIPVIGFIAHVDTSPDMPGANVNPQIIEKYDGGNILINREKDLVLTPQEFPELLHYTGDTLITTDGNTLLGADDKAGIAEIMTLAEFLLSKPGLEHGTVKIGFTPDEEIGRGVDHFDVKKFGADFAYTMDGGGIGELEYENFNAALAKINIQGRNIHPGYAKDKMINAILLAMEFNALLPVNQRPEYTRDYDGFFHVIRSEGSVENASLQYIIRDHDRPKFEQKKTLMQQCVDFMNQRYGQKVFTLELRDQYFNMKEKIEPVMHIVETARQAMINSGVEPLVIPIRGGTDGSRLSYMGLPCPNIFAGGLNFHGKFEYVSLQSMEKAVEVMKEILRLYAADAN